jgi:hypothetical protein
MRQVVLAEVSIAAEGYPVECRRFTISNILRRPCESCGSDRPTPLVGSSSDAVGGGGGLSNISVELEESVTGLGEREEGDIV